MSAIELLCSVIGEGAKVPVVSLRYHQDFLSLLACGLLREAGLVTGIACIECGEPHSAEVIFNANEYGYFCPDLGFVRVSRREISGIEPDLPYLVAHLADTFACTRRKDKPIHGNTWRIGAVKTDHGEITVYFHPHLRDERDARALADALSREVASTWRVVVTAGGQLPVSDATTVTLSELVEFSPNEKSFTPMLDLRAIVGVPTSPKTGAPNRFGEKCMALIRSRIASGTALAGRNEEAKAVRAMLQIDQESEVPSLPTVRAYVTKARSG
ncbi:hypothetical protein [Leisingera sp. ANG-S5]|uniref:hypothetical protein n=1 Tax=Leisingera sp. ANG-S5 TaxID=1577901 RepID=UPI001269CBC6|nr:hypothetical protein [Leisingera sp. ANG-S5]